MDVIKKLVVQVDVTSIFDEQPPGYMMWLASCFIMEQMLIKEERF